MFLTLSWYEGFRGPPDPVHGDTYYKSVREEAQNVLNALFDVEENPKFIPEEPAEQKAAQNMAVPDKAADLPAAADIAFLSPSNGSRKYMPGMGNTNYAPPRG